MIKFLLILSIALCVSCGNIESSSQTSNSPQVSEVSLESAKCGDFWFSADVIIDGQLAEIQLAGDSGPSRYPIPAFVTRNSEGQKKSVVLNFENGYLKLRLYNENSAYGYWKENLNSSELGMHCNLN
jgi:hypothetical protein